LIAGSSSRVPSLAASSIQVMRMADAFAGLGHEVTLLVPSGRGELGGLSVPDERAFYGVSAPFTLVRAFTPRPGRTAELWFALAARRRAGAPAHPKRSHPKPWDLILSRHALSTVLCARAGIRHVYEAHHVRLKGRVDHWLLPALRSPAVMRVVAIAETLATELVRHGIARQKILVAPDAADFPPGGESPATRPERPGLRCAYAGSLDPLKGLPTLLGAARALPAVEFTVIGGMPAARLPLARAEAGPNVMLVGAVPPAAVAEQLASADVLLMPHAEGATARYLSPLKLFEYLAAGRPIVASDLKATREILTHEENALLVPPDDPPALAHAIARLAADPALRARLGAAARRSAAGHGWRDRAAQILSSLPAPHPGQLRIGHLLNSFHPLVGGAERQAAALGDRQAARGHEVTAITRRRPGLPAVDGLGGVAIHRLFAGFGAPSFVAAGAWFLATRPAPFDVLHAHQARSNAVLGLVGRPAHGPLVVKVAGLDVPRGRRLGDRLRLGLLRRADAVVALTGVMRDELLRLGVPADRLHVIPNGVDVAHFRPASASERARARAARGLDPDRPLVLYMGRLETVKGPDLALAAFEDLARDGLTQNAQLLIAGAGPLAAGLAVQARALAGGQVQLLGATQDPAELYRAADILIAPSRAEGLSNTLLEAMAAGLAILATAVGGNMELLVDGQTACVVPLARAPLAAALRDLLADPERRAALGAAAAREARRTYDLDRIADRYDQLYRALIG
jgi:glycosyltransferase involved in cell wall biosynthesis